MEMVINVNDTYSSSYVEVLAILRLLPREEYNRIPQEKIDFFEKYKNPDYQFEYDEEKHNTLKKTDAIIVNLFKNYFATDEEKKEIDQKLYDNFVKSEQEKKEQFKNVDIFANNKKYNEASVSTIQNENIENVETVEETNDLIEINESIFTKIINKIKSIFKK